MIADRGDPIRQGLRPRGLRVGIVRRAEDGDKHLRRADGAGAAVLYRHGLAGVIDEEFLAGAVLLPQTAIQGLGPGPVEITKPTVLIAVRRLGAVLLPQQREGDALACELAMDGGPVRQGPVPLRLVRPGRIEARVQLRVGQSLGQGPRHPGRPRTTQRLGHRTARHPATGGNLPVGEPTGPVESQNVLDLLHGHSLRWHRHLLVRMEAARYQGCGGPARDSLRAEATTGCRARIPRDAGHRFRGSSEKWPTSGRNQRPRSVGMGGRLASESVAGMTRNTHPA